MLCLKVGVNVQGNRVLSDNTPDWVFPIIEWQNENVVIVAAVVNNEIVKKTQSEVRLAIMNAGYSPSNGISLDFSLVDANTLNTVIKPFGSKR
jgi:hypothetical protein